MKLLIGIAIFLICTIGTTIMVDGILMGFPIPAIPKKVYPKEYVIKEKNRIDYQKSTECSGFSSAYVMRSFGVEAEGNAMYAQIPGKLKNGAVLPKKLKKALKQYGFFVQYRKGNLHSLKAELCKGNRVIAFVKTRPDKRWLHYIPVVGYDEENIFVAESLPYLVNYKDEGYNRKLTNQEFLQIWDTREIYMPLYKNTYLVVGKSK